MNYVCRFSLLNYLHFGKPNKDRWELTKRRSETTGH